MMRMIVLIVGLMLATPALAQTNALDVPANVTVMYIPLEQMVEVSPDRLKARLRIERRGDSPARLQQEINAEMAKAVSLLKKHPSIRLETGFYNSYMQQEKNFTSWFASQELILDSADAALLLERVGELQRDFVMSGLDYYLSPAAQQAKEQELRLAALANLDAQAKAYAKAMGRAGFDIRQVQFHSSGISYPAMTYAAPKAMMASAAMESAPAAAEGGIITVRVAGEAMVLLKP